MAGLKKNIFTSFHFIHDSKFLKGLDFTLFSKEVFKLSILTSIYI